MKRGQRGKSDERVRTGKKRKDRKTAKVRGEKGDEKMIEREEVRRGEGNSS